ncbi:hypothetical protein [Lacunimicrobium album]
MQGEGESKKQSRLAWMEKLLIGVSLLLLVGFGAVLFGVPFLNDAVIRNAQKSVAKALGAGPDPKLLSGASSASSSGGARIGQLGEKCPTKTIAVTLDVDTPLNRQVSELLAKKLNESGEFENVKFFDSSETAEEDFDNWVSVHIDETSLLSSFKREQLSDGKQQTQVSVKYIVMSEPTHQTTRHEESPLADPLANVSGGIEVKKEFIYRGGIDLEELRSMLPEKLVEEISDRLFEVRRRHEKTFGELPADLSKGFWPTLIRAETPSLLNDFRHRQLRSTNGFLISSDAVWLVEVPSMELRDFYRRAQAEFGPKGFGELSHNRRPFKLDQAIFTIPDDCIALSNSPDHNDFWEIYPAPRAELVHESRKTLPAATTLLYVHYCRMLSKNEYRSLVNQMAKAPDVTLEKVLMFRKELVAIDEAGFEELIKRFESSENNLLLSLISFEVDDKGMSDDDRIKIWKQLFIRLLKEDPEERYESILSSMIGTQAKEKIFETMAEDLRVAGIPELVETSSNIFTLRPGEVYSAILTDPTDKTSIAKSYLHRSPTGEVILRQVIQTNSGVSTNSPSLSTDGKSHSINAGYNDFRVEGTVRLLDPATGEVEVELKKGKP